MARSMVASMIRLLSLLLEAALRGHFLLLTFFILSACWPWRMAAGARVGILVLFGLPTAAMLLLRERIAEIFASHKDSTYSDKKPLSGLALALGVVHAWLVVGVIWLLSTGKAWEPLAAALFITYAGAAAWKWFSSVPRRLLHSNTLRLLGSPDAKPEALLAAVEGFLAEGSALSELPLAEVVRRLNAGGITPRLLGNDGLSSAERTSLLRVMAAESSVSPGKRDVLPDDALRAISGMPDLLDEAVLIYDRAGALDFLAHDQARRLPEVCPALAEALGRTSRPAACFEVLKRLDTARLEEVRMVIDWLAAEDRLAEAPALVVKVAPHLIGDYEKVVCLKAHLSRGDFQKAREAFLEVSPVMFIQDRTPCYDFVLLAERCGSRGEAAEAYKRFIAPDPAYVQAFDHYRSLKEELPARGPAAPREAAPGLVAGTYEIGPRIGRGGMGIVYEAFDRKFGRRVAVKKMREEIRDSPRHRDQFLNEARIISRVSHPFIVSVHDIVEEGEEIYLVFDFVEGAPLSHLIHERGRLPLAQCQRLLDPVCQAVAFAHSSRVLHRDLKPANIMIDASGLARVMDFGLARVAKDSVSQVTQQDTSGTPAYMAPEQHLGKSIRPSDVYSLGVCLYECLTGQLPFHGPDFLAQKERMKFLPPQFLVPELGMKAGLFIAAALQADPSKRIQDAELFRQSLLSL